MTQWHWSQPELRGFHFVLFVYSADMSIRVCGAVCALRKAGVQVLDEGTIPLDVAGTLGRNKKRKANKHNHPNICRLLTLDSISRGAGGAEGGRGGGSACLRSTANLRTPTEGPFHFKQPIIRKHKQSTMAALQLQMLIYRAV